MFSYRCVYDKWHGFHVISVELFTGAYFICLSSNDMMWDKNRETGKYQTMDVEMTWLFSDMCLLVYSVLWPSSIRRLATPWMCFLHLSLSSVILIESSTRSPVHVLMLSISLSPGNSLVSSWCDNSMLVCLLWQCLTVPCVLHCEFAAVLNALECHFIMYYNGIRFVVLQWKVVFS